MNSLKRYSGWACGLVALVMLANSPASAGEITKRSGDWTVSDHEIISDKHIHICEWMQSGGIVEVTSLRKRDDMTFGCTTLELSGEAKLIADNVHFGRPMTWQPEKSIGEANVKGEARLEAKNISINNMRFRTEDSGQVSLQGYTQVGTLETKAEGGAIELTKASLTSEKTKPKVWIYTDMSDPTLKGSNHRGTINDPDDVSAMAGYLLMANEFETLGIVVASTHRQEHRTTPNQADWANRLFGGAYRADLPQLQNQFEGFPNEISFVQSSIKSTAEKFVESKDYHSLENYPTVSPLLEQTQALVEGQTINVLCWGSVTEPAILAAHCVATGKLELLKRLRFIAHWTNSPLHQGSAEHPEDVANCREDAAACAYMKKLAESGKLVYHECGAIGQAGIVSGGPKGHDYFDQFKTSQLGTIFVEGKYVQNGVDHSDSATYWVLLGTYGVSLNDIPSNGANSAAIEQANETKFRTNARRIHDELLSRSRAGNR